MILIVTPIIVIIIIITIIIIIIMTIMIAIIVTIILAIIITMLNDTKNFKEVLTVIVPIMISIFFLGN